ncbi:MAG: ATP-binding protein [Flavobacteriales bacterium]|nr:ATP-binding protein [Flavobacteriales bacterium]
MNLPESINEQLKFESKLNNVNNVESIVDDVCEKLQINDDFYGNMLIAITEAVNNAIKHGNKEDSNKAVLLSYETLENDLLFTIKDEGFGFDFNNIPDPTIPENINKVNGRGVFIMKSLADEVTFTENGTCVKLKFSVSYN